MCLEDGGAVLADAGKVRNDLSLEFRRVSFGPRRTVRRTDRHDAHDLTPRETIGQGRELRDLHFGVSRLAQFDLRCFHVDPILPTAMQQNLFSLFESYKGIMISRLDRLDPIQ